MSFEIGGGGLILVEDIYACAGLSDGCRGGGGGSRSEKIMAHVSEPRLNYFAVAPELVGHLNKLSMDIHKGGLGHKLLALVEMRASQINGCAFCLDMHAKQAKLAGERELRLYALPAWRESPLFDERERAALAWTEAVTRIATVSAAEEREAYQEARAQFSDMELTELTLAIVTINAYNRLAITSHAVPGALDKEYGLDRAGLH